METSLGLDNRAKQLCLHFKKRIEHSSDTVLKLRGTLNTVTAAADVTSTLNKFFRLGAAPSPQLGEIYQPDTRIRLGLGAKASTATEDIFFRCGQAAAAAAALWCPYPAGAFGAPILAGGPRSSIWCLTIHTRPATRPARPPPARRPAA